MDWYLDPLAAGAVDEMPLQFRLAFAIATDGDGVADITRIDPRDTEIIQTYWIE